MAVKDWMAVGMIVLGLTGWTAYYVQARLWDERPHALLFAGHVLGVCALSRDLRQRPGHRTASGGRRGEKGGKAGWRLSLHCLRWT